MSRPRKWHEAAERKQPPRLMTPPEWIAAVRHMLARFKSALMQPAPGGAQWKRELNGGRR